ncbi:MAG: hypothetical protein IPP47_21055 [Bryobacterales bacterium]|nr:hypothetical protein [Bryobacterales bacterium]
MIAVVALALLLGDPPDPASVLQRAPSAPPEIAAKILVNFGANAYKVPDRARRIELVEEAFRLAALARQPYPLATAIWPVPPDSEAVRLLEANQERLDGLGLQVRAVQAMMALDPRRALEMALRMPIPSPPRRTCKDSMIARVEEYYGLALQIAHRGFSTKEKAEGRPLQFLTGIVQASTTPEQIQAAVAMVRTFKGSPEDTAALVTALTSALTETQPNSRGFIGTPAVGEELAPLIRGLRAAGRSTLPLLEAYRTYLVTQWSGEACSDLPEAHGLLIFNDTLRKDAGLEKEVPAIDTKNLKPKRSNDKPANYVFGEEGESREIFKEMAGLRHPPEKAGPEWESKFTALLHRIEAWQPEDGVTPLAHFHRKAGAFRDLLPAAISEPLLETLQSAFCTYLRDAPAKTESPAEWMIHFRRMTMPWGPLGARSVEIAKREIRRGGDGLMNLLVDAGETF